MLQSHTHRKWKLWV